MSRRESIAAVLKTHLRGPGCLLPRSTRYRLAALAEARGTRAKTDKVDAAVPAHMGVALQPGICTVPSKMLRDLKELQIARQALIKDRTAAKNRCKSLRLPMLKKQSNLRLRQIKHSLEAIHA